MRFGAGKAVRPADSTLLRFPSGARGDFDHGL